MKSEFDYRQISECMVKYLVIYIIRYLKGGVMPPITRITKEDIIQTAYEITRKEGLKAVNARAIAKQLNCSIQPIFHKFQTMEGLKEEVVKMVYQEYTHYIEQGLKHEKPYKGMGLAYIEFARKEPKLFQLLFMTEQGKSVETILKEDPGFQIIQNTIQEVTGLKENDVESFHLQMWIYTHGIATMLATHTCTMNDEQISHLLTQGYEGLLYQYKKGKEA